MRYTRKINNEQLVAAIKAVGETLIERAEEYGANVHTDTLNKFNISINIPVNWDEMATININKEELSFAVYVAMRKIAEAENG